MFYLPLGWYSSYCAAKLVTRTSDRKQNKTSLHTVYFVTPSYIKLHFKSNLPPPISEGFHFHFVSCLFSLLTWWVSRLVREYLAKFYAPKVHRGRLRLRERENERNGVFWSRRNSPLTRPDVTCALSILFLCQHKNVSESFLSVHSTHS